MKNYITPDVELYKVMKSDVITSSGDPDTPVVQVPSNQNNDITI